MSIFNCLSYYKQPFMGIRRVHGVCHKLEVYEGKRAQSLLSSNHLFQKPSLSHIPQRSQNLPLAEPPALLSITQTATEVPPPHRAVLCSDGCQPRTSHPSGCGGKMEGRQGTAKPKFPVSYRYSQLRVYSTRRRGNLGQPAFHNRWRFIHSFNKKS